MDLNEAISQIKQVSSVLEAFKTVDDLLSVVIASQEQIEGLVKQKIDLEAAVSEKGAEFIALDEKYKTLSTQLEENFERAKAASKEAMRNLKDSVTKQHEEAQAVSHAQLAELGETVKNLKSEARALDQEVTEKQTLLAELNKAIDAVKAKFGA